MLTPITYVGSSNITQQQVARINVHVAAVNKAQAEGGGAQNMRANIAGVFDM